MQEGIRRALYDEFPVEDRVDVVAVVVLPNLVKLVTLGLVVRHPGGLHPVGPDLTPLGRRAHAFDLLEVEVDPTAVLPLGATLLTFLNPLLDVLHRAPGAVNDVAARFEVIGDRIPEEVEDVHRFGHWPLVDEDLLIGLQLVAVAALQRYDLHALAELVLPEHLLDAKAVPETRAHCFLKT